jgi:hypothetical protein
MKHRLPLLTIALAMFAVLAAGCIPPLTLSINPLYTEKDIVYESNIEGLWYPNDDSLIFGDWKFTKGDKNCYNLEIGGGDLSRFKTYLFKINEDNYMDLYPDLAASRFGGLFSLLMVRTHMFFKVNKTASTMELTSINIYGLSRYLMEHPDAMPDAFFFYQKDLDPEEPEPWILLTASTEKLQEFFIKSRPAAGLFAGMVFKLERSKKNSSPLQNDNYYHDRSETYRGFHRRGSPR